MKLLLGAIVMVISLSIILVGIHKGVNGVLDDGEQLRSVVGKAIVLNKDTLIVTDYSLLRSEYTLSNGITVSENFKFTFIK